MPSTRQCKKKRVNNALWLLLETFAVFPPVILSESLDPWRRLNPGKRKPSARGSLASRFFRAAHIITLSRARPEWTAAGHSTEPERSGATTVPRRTGWEEWRTRRNGILIDFCGEEAKRTWQPQIGFPLRARAGARRSEAAPHPRSVTPPHRPAGLRPTGQRRVKGEAGLAPHSTNAWQ